MDEMFITCILDIVDPKRELSPQEVVKLVEEKFTSTNTLSTAIAQIAVSLNEAIALIDNKLLVRAANVIRGVILQLRAL